jgi:hypothetical protein
MVQIISVNEIARLDDKGKPTDEVFYNFTVVGKFVRKRVDDDTVYYDSIKLRMSAGGMSDDKALCESCIGDELNEVTIKRVDCDAYDWVDPEGNNHTLTHTYKLVRSES